MALELVGGAALGAALRMLLKEVIDAKEKASNFQHALTRLESTLRSVIPRVNEISRMNHKLKVPDEEMKEVITILRNGQALVNKSSKISSINFVRKGQYSKQLIELDHSLLRYFQTILLLDHFRDSKEVLLKTREIHMKLFSAKDEGESSKPKVDEYSEIQSCQDPEKKETVKLFRKIVQELHMGLVGAKDDGESIKPKEDESSQEPDEGESSKPKVDVYSEIQSCQDPEKKETVTLFGNLLWYMGLVGAKDEGESSKPKEDVYPATKLEWVTKIEDKLSDLEDTWKFWLKGCTYTFDLKDRSYTNLDSGILYQNKRTNDVKLCECKAKGHGYVRVGRIEAVKIGKGEFEQQMETSGRIGNHPNIRRPFGYCFYQSELFLFYDSFRNDRSLYTTFRNDGSLYTSVHKSIRGPCDSLNWRTTFKISLGMARGISHLHSVKCIHGNLHSSNVLVNWKRDGCISDYGLLNFSSAAKKSDVHSFGVILLEMLSNSKPCYFDSAKEELHQWIERVVSPQNLFETTSGIKIDNEEGEMLRIAKLCVEKDLDKRPEMDDVVKMIQKIWTPI